MGWNVKNLKAVSIQTIGNGLWLGTLVWLVLGLWLEVVGFIPCWVGATLFSWVVAIWRGARTIVRAEMDEELSMGSLKGADSSESDVTQILFSALDDMEKEVGSTGLIHIKDVISAEFIKRPDFHPLQSNLKDTNARSLVLYSILTTVWNKLTFGDYHTGRGVLNATGKELLKLREYATEQLRLNGEMSE